MRFDKILVIADRAEEVNQQAFDLALKIARSGGRGSRLRLVGFAYDPDVEIGGLYGGDERGTIKDELLKETERRLKDAVSTRSRGKIPVAMDVAWTPRIEDWVTEQVGEGEVDLVVKTGHRSEKFWYTPTDWRLLREVDCPILIAAPKPWRSEGRVLASVDPVSRSQTQRRLDEKVLTAASEMAERFGAELHVVHAVHVSEVLLDLDAVTRKGVMDRFRKKHAAKLYRLAEAHGVPEERVHLKMGKAHKVVPSIANKVKADLVVMGTIGRKGAKRALLGNTAESTMQVLRTNILAIKP